MSSPSTRANSSARPSRPALSSMPKRPSNSSRRPTISRERMVDLAGIGAGDIALEPCAGLGRIVRHLIARGARSMPSRSTRNQLQGAPRDRRTSAASPSRTSRTHARCDAARFDAVVMNPPFANNLDIQHIRAAWQHVRPGGRLVAICSEGPFFRQDGAAGVPRMAGRDRRRHREAARRHVPRKRHRRRHPADRRHQHPVRRPGGTRGKRRPPPSTFR